MAAPRPDTEHEGDKRTEDFECRQITRGIERRFAQQLATSSHVPRPEGLDLLCGDVSSAPAFDTRLGAGDIAIAAREA